MNIKKCQKIDEHIADIKDTIDYLTDSPTNIICFKKHIKHIEESIKEIKKIDSKTDYSGVHKWE